MKIQLINKIALCILVSVLSFNVYSQCILPPTDNFDEFYALLSERKDWKKKMERNTIRLENYKYKSEVDSLFQYCISYFKDRLPEDLICSQVDVYDSAWLSFHNMSIKMGFAFNLSVENSGRYGERITVRFNYDIKSKKIYAHSSQRHLWIPDCKNHPDSCNFKITSIKQSEEIARSIGFIDKNERASSSSRIGLPFHYSLTKTIDDDCGTQTLYINMYNKDTVMSLRNIAYGCQTWKDKIDGSTLVIDGTVIEEEAFSIDGSIYTKAKIEIHHLFKGKIKSNHVYVIVKGGTLGRTTSSLSHGQIGLGEKGARKIYFLNRNEKYEDNLIPIEKLLGQQVHITNYYPFSSRLEYTSVKYDDTSYEAQFRRIEKITGSKRQVILSPRTWDEKILETLKTVPDRQKGLEILLQEEYRKSFKDSIYIYLAMSSTNDILYLKKWEFNLTYDTLAFGSRIIEKKKANIFDDHKAFKRLKEHYNLEVKDASDNTIKLKWVAKDTTEIYFELFPAKRDKPKMQFILTIKLSVKDPSKSMNLKMELAEQPTGYDYALEQEYQIKHDSKSNRITNPHSYYKAPEIVDFQPRNASIGDTIIVNGNYLENTTPMLFGKSLSGKEKFLALEKKDIIAINSSKIVFVIPPYLTDKPRIKPINLGNETFKPTTNIIHFKKKTAYKGASTKEKMVIYFN